MIDAAGVLCLCEMAVSQTHAHVMLCMVRYDIYINRATSTSTDICIDF